MKKLLLTTAMAFIIPLSAQAQEGPELVSYSELPSGTYSVDPTHASLVWKVSHYGLADYTARFNKFDADINYNAEDPAQSTIMVTVDPTSVDTDHPDKERGFNEELATGATWFNADEFPEITFNSTALEMTGESTGKLTGDLTFLGVTKPLTLDVTFNGGYIEKPHAGVPAMGFSATGTMDRSEWGFDTYAPNIGTEVELLIEAEFEKDQEANE